MSELAAKSCVPCAGGVPPLTEEEWRGFLAEVHDDWRVVDGHHLERSIGFSNFLDPLNLANDVGALAEREGHHPDLLVRWGELKVMIWTHKIDGLTESDFVLAAKIDRLPSAIQGV